MINNRPSDPISYFPPYYAIHIRKELVDANVIPVFTRIPKNVVLDGKREIANIDFENKEGHGDKEVELDVYITEAENLKEVAIYVYKGGWGEPKERDFHTDRFGIWAGYLRTKIAIGDPPIAVG